jgi:hypothetical protein
MTTTMAVRTLALALAALLPIAALVAAVVYQPDDPALLRTRTVHGVYEAAREVHGRFWGVTIAGERVHTCTGPIFPGTDDALAVPPHRRVVAEFNDLPTLGGRVPVLVSLRAEAGDERYLDVPLAERRRRFRRATLVDLGWSLLLALLFLLVWLSARRDAAAR